MERFRPRSVSRMNVKGFLLTVATTTPPEAVCSLLVRAPSRLFTAIIRSPGTVNRFGLVLLMAILAWPPFTIGTTVGASVPTPAITLQEKNRPPNIIAVLFFLIVCFPEIIQPGHPVFPLQNKDVMFDISERF